MFGAGIAAVPQVVSVCRRNKQVASLEGSSASVKDTLELSWTSRSDPTQDLSDPFAKVFTALQLQRGAEKSAEFSHACH